MKTHPYGEGALFVDLELEVAPLRVRKTHAVAAAVRRRLPDVDVVVGVGTLALVGLGAWDDIEDVVAAALHAGDGHRPEPTHHAIAVVYDGTDLDEVAKRVGLSSRQLIEAHASRDYTVELIGFLPGFAYLGPVDDRIVVPRRETPRPQVPAGSLALAGAYTGVYPFASPGGWQLIGRAVDATLFDATRSPPALLQPGDQVRFVPRRA